MNEYMEAVKHSLANNGVVGVIFVIAWGLFLVSAIFRKENHYRHRTEVRTLRSKIVETIFCMLFFGFVFYTFFLEGSRTNTAFLEQYEETLIKLPSDNVVPATFTEEVGVSVGDVVFEVWSVKKGGLSLVINGEKHNIQGSSLVGYDPTNDTYTTNGINVDMQKAEKVLCTVTYIGEGKFSLDFANGSARVAPTLENVQVVSMEDEFAALEVSDTYSFVVNDVVPRHKMGKGETNHVFPSNAFSDIYIY